MSYKRDVAYFFDEEIGVYHFATNHVMKPLRDVMTNELIQKYGLYPKMKIYVHSSPSCPHSNFS